MLWQDNNTVLIIIIIYRPNEVIEKLRKRLSLTLINIFIVRPVFRDSHHKLLYIPLAINAYNHYINSVNQNNQLRVNLTVHRAFKIRNWRLILYYILNTYLVNSYLI
jgi:Transposase IS4